MEVYSRTCLIYSPTICWINMCVWTVYITMKWTVYITMNNQTEIPVLRILKIQIICKTNKLYIILTFVSLISVPLYFIYFYFSHIHWIPTALSPSSILRSSSSHLPSPLIHSSSRSLHIKSRSFYLVNQTCDNKLQ